MPVIRALSMPEALVDILADHLARAGLTGANADSFVFPAPSGGHLSYANYWGRRWQPATTKAGVAGVVMASLRVGLDRSYLAQLLNTDPPGRRPVQATQHSMRYPSLNMGNWTLLTGDSSA